MENAHMWFIGGIALAVFLIALGFEIATDVVWLRKTLVELREKREKRQQEGKDTTCSPQS